MYIPLTRRFCTVDHYKLRIKSAILCCVPESCANELFGLKYSLKQGLHVPGIERVRAMLPRAILPAQWQVTRERQNVPKHFKANSNRNLIPSWRNIIITD